jgi:hypothetical protein
MICRNVDGFAAVRSFGLAALSDTLRKSGISLMLAVLWLCAPGSLPAQTVTTLYEFGAGGNPDGGLVQSTERLIPPGVRRTCPYRRTRRPGWLPN